MILAGTGVWLMQGYNERVAAYEKASQRAINGEHLNRLITAVVMDSRGVYMSKSVEAAKPFATGIGKGLGETKILLEGWSASVPDERRTAFDKVVAKAREFIDFRSETARLGTEVGDLIASLADAAGTALQSARSMAADADDNAGRASTVASASEQTSANVQAVASASEELTASIGEIGRQIQSASDLIGDAVNQAEETDKNVRSLVDSATKVGDIVSMILAIAAQTNLLALNATIEAARAGEAGKGFAVVANEVKNLAAQTARATQEIEGQMATIQVATQQSAVKIGDISRQIRDLD